MNKHYRLAVVMAALGIVTFIANIEAATIHIHEDGTGDFPTIQAAIDDPGRTTGDTIAVHAGTYNELITLDGSKTLTLHAVDGPDLTTISGDIDGDGSGNGSVIIYINGDCSVLDGFTITGGSGTNDPWGTNYGGGIYCSDSSPTIKNCSITNNSASSHGGGIYLGHSSPTIIDSTISSNTASLNGGGIYCYYSSPIIIDKCSISKNTASSYGGGIFSYHSSPLITTCTISENSSLIENYGGGGIACMSSSPSIIKSIIKSNYAAGNGAGIFCSISSTTTTNSSITQNYTSGFYARAGGFYSAHTSLSIVNSIIGNNSTIYQGGGIYCWSSSPKITNCTITENSTLSLGGGIYCHFSSSPIVVNSILWGDTDAVGSNEIYLSDATSSITVNFSDIEGGWAGAGNINVVPLLVGGGDYSLTPGSVCIDSGTPIGAPISDIESNYRPQWAGYDIGAYEYNAEGNFCSFSETRSCGTGLLGVCAVGTRICNESGYWEACDPNNLPTQEICDGLDNDCDGLIDEDLGTLTCGIGGCQVTVDYCVNGAVNVCTPTGPSAEEVLCDGIDNDCDGILPVEDIDGDGDGVLACKGDCDDTDSNTYPDAPDVCNGDGVDNDCDGNSDEGLTYYLDRDGDGYGYDDPNDPNDVTEDCTAPVGYVTNNSDCDDNDQDIHPTAVENCEDGKDNDCDGLYDEPTIYYHDGDGDGYGNLYDTIEVCSQPEKYVSDNTDCYDRDPAMNPGHNEICDGKDNDCDRQVDEEFDVGISCSEGIGACEVMGSRICFGDRLTTICGVTPGILDIELCGDGIDNDCDGVTDDDFPSLGDPCDGTDADLCPDGTYICNATGDGVTCDDATDDPQHLETCDGVDNNCNIDVDEGLDCNVVIYLDSGWNLISLNLQPVDIAIGEVLSTVSDSCNSVWAFNKGLWATYYSDKPESSNLATMEVGSGYWLNMSAPATLQVSGYTPSKTISLEKGWNLVGFNSSKPLPIADALESIAGYYESVWIFSNGVWKSYYPNIPNSSDFQIMEPNYGYWIKTTQSCNLTLP